LVGVTKANSIVEVEMLEHALRDNLDKTSPRAMCVLRPLKVVIRNYPADKTEDMVMPRHPKDESMGVRTIPFTREIFIDRTDFEVEPLPGFKRLLLGGEVRLRGSYVIKCEEVLRDDKGSITELICSCDEATLGAKPEGRKVKGVIHWVSAEKALDVEVRLFDRLFSHENPDAADGDYRDFINPDSLQVFSESKAEPSLADAQSEDRFQFEREGYFCVDNKDSSANSLVFNLTVSLRDTWAKKNKS